jgi:3-dehydroquinate synthase
VKKKNKFYSNSIDQHTEVVFEDSINSLGSLFAEANIILVDKRLRKSVSVFKYSKPLILFLDGAESTKSMATLTKILDQIFKNKKIDVNKKTKLVVIGGGTLGDFGGFLSHILKRGLPLILVPSTWLSAMDSAHGGKNGINFKDLKNQLGTIYSAQKVILVKSLLNQQPIDRTVEGFGELIKISYIHSQNFFRQVSKERLSSLDLFSYLPAAIDAKYSIVKKDPFEKKGIRYLLNFGHTIGHVWEAKLNIHHGIAVLLGMYFDFLWASARGNKIDRDIEVFFSSEIVRSVLGLFYNERLFSLSESVVAKALSADKKKENQFVRYVFPDKAGKLKVVSVTVDQIVKEYQRQQQIIGLNFERQYSTV